MGRAKVFEDNAALEKAMFLFWEKGYENTSLKDLLQEMNILNGSFYNSFGNKKNLLLKVLAYYGQEVTSKRAEILMTQPNFKSGLRAVFSEMMKCIGDKSLPSGCLIGNTLTNELLEDPEIKSFVLAEVQKSQAFFEKQLSKAIKSGELPENINPKAKAKIIMTYLQGVMRLSCLEFDEQKMNQQNEDFFRSLGL